ncbi:small acid-soluble spore protein O (minor) [Amphibacillus marinus]|uniref:Small acid-soluble spore protein O n=1 Tax=Amphibacillus marinus TaxID=872970 RepID=A0A1H8LTA6_9BACI|nr:small acid-soluble spore protein O (minor) [Amphibacillus marinus]
MELTHPSNMEVIELTKRDDAYIKRPVNDQQAKKQTMPREFDHEFANEPLTEMEKKHNKKTKKRQ